MVGFGSSLRLARRPGWEDGAYLDYETLKLLLSQIEAVYEEEGHSRMSRENSQSDALWDMEMIDELNNGRRRSRKNGRKTKTVSKARDYKDELFLEANSEAAYLSVEEEDFTTDEDEEASEFHSSSQNHSLAQTQPVKPFTLSYSHEQHSSSDEDIANGCLPNFGSSSKANRGGSSSVGSNGSKKMKKRRKGTPMMSTEDEDTFYNVTAPPVSGGTFFLPNSNEAMTPTASNVPSSTDYSNSLHYFPTPAYGASETTSLLPNSSTGAHSPKGSLFTFSSAGGALTPPTRNSQYAKRRITGAPDMPRDSTTPPGANQLAPMYQQQQQQQQQEQQQTPAKNKETTKRQKQKDWRFRRVRQKQRAVRAKRERKVPRHLRIAHAKARAITERFLGLLRAETEKVLLFAQARLGELADTAGSLRFPSFDEEFAHNNSQIGKHSSNRASSYEFGDGGRHPSGSSSSEDGAGFGRQQWSDSSEENDNIPNTLHNKGSGSNHKMSGMTSARSVSTSASTRVMNMPKSISDEKISSDQDDAINSRRDSTARTKDIENTQIVRRQIAQFTELRKHRAVFQRNDQVLGEDMLFLSAVEEADGYTGVGVELMHVLKYICVNLIAVRKICRKHDRLLMNRMLGGYYQRVHRGDASYSGEDVKTLGGLVARVSGDIYEAHPALIGQMNHFKLVGVYDKKIQKLANSRTVQVVSSCLALSLSEYEVARSRADALTRLNSTASLDGSPKDSAARNYTGVIDSSDVDSVDDPPSTASSISLTRLRYTVMSIFALREASRSKINHLMTYLSRAALTFTGQPVVGEGLDGCSRETLDFLVSYNPDSALLLDSGVLFDGLKQNLWSRTPMADIMIATLAAGATTEFVAAEVASALRTAEETTVAHAVSLVPESKTFMLKRLKNGQFPHFKDRSSNPIEGIPASALNLNRVSVFLYMMNYFVTHATTHVFVKAVGEPSPLSASVIGIPNVSAALISVLHCFLASRTSCAAGRCRFRSRTIRWLMIFGSLMAIIGNALHATAIDRNSVMMALAGRLVTGFSFAEILQREVMGACIPSLVIAESGRLMLARMFGIAVGLFAGAIIAAPLAREMKGLGVAFSPHSRQLQSGNWAMMVAWLFQLVFVLVQLRPQEKFSLPPDYDVAGEAHGRDLAGTAVGVEIDSDSSSSADIGTPSSVLYRSSSDVTPVGGPMAALGNCDRVPDMDVNKIESPSARRDRLVAIKNQPRASSRQWKTIGRIRKLFSFHIAIPVSLIMFLFVTLAMELFLTATPLITSVYFDWSGSRAGTCLGVLSVAVLPINYVCEIVARRYEERTILKRAIVIVGSGLFLMINWGSLFSLAPQATELFRDTLSRPSHYYDWKLGAFQWGIGVSIVFVGLVAMEGAALSLLSKCSPSTRSIVSNVGTMTTFIGLFARFLGDFHIVTVGLSHKLINTDMVNALVGPLFLTCFILAHVVNKHFFFLM